ncbi:MAG TPA: glycosyltransferase family 1 protein, partial [Rhodospirillales bacterium]|nr:glycosyltransferase family 1 protein [Rhodospirillales bacterium]
MLPKIIICANTSWYLYNFRANLINKLSENGHSVLAVAPVDEYVQLLRSLDCRYLPFEIDNRGTHPGRDLLLFWRFILLLRREKPEILLTYTVKPNIFGSLAARVCAVPVINNISGLGAVFIETSWVTKLVMGLYRLSLARSKKVFFQNKDDQNHFVSSRLVQ